MKPTKLSILLKKIWKIFIPRKVLPQTDGQQEIELHGLSDARLQGCRACVYQESFEIRSSQYTFSTFKVNSCPIKSTAITKLESLGNVLLIWLMASIKNAHSKVINISNCFYWTDSNVFLAWTTSQSKNYRTFESKVRKITENADIWRWFCCESKSNPANLLAFSKAFVFNKIIYSGGVVYFLSE